MYASLEKSKIIVIHDESDWLHLMTNHKVLF
jgi:hypothetical protein